MSASIGDQIENPLPGCESSVKFLLLWLRILRNTRIRKRW
jgi:hypothetical protein